MYIDITCCFPVSPSFFLFPTFVLIYCLRFVYPMLSVSIDSQFLLSTSVFSYVYFESVADTFLFYWINVCFGDFM